MKARSIQGKSTEDIQLALQQSIHEGFNPSLAIIFMSVNVDRNELGKYFADFGIAIFGATSGGEFIGGEVGTDSIAVLLLEIEKSSFEVFIAEALSDKTRETAAELASKASQRFSEPSILVVGSGMSIDGELIIRGIEDVLGKEISLWGGMAGEDLKGIATYVFSNHMSTSNGICLLAFDANKISVKGRSSSGWKGMGQVKTVTKSEGMWIHTIDHQPALKQLTHFLGIDFSDKEKIVEILHNVPMSGFLLYRDEGEPIIRGTVAVDSDYGYLKLTANIEEGSKIQIAIPPEFEVIDEIIEDYGKARRSGIDQADAIVMFSCSGRQAHLGPMISNEIDALIDVYKSPVAGFFTYGEFGRATEGENEFHNYTCCWVALKEK